MQQQICVLKRKPNLCQLGTKYCALGHYVTLAAYIGFTWSLNLLFLPILTNKYQICLKKRKQCTVEITFSSKWDQGTRWSEAAGFVSVFFLACVEKRLRHLSNRCAVDCTVRSLGRNCRTELRPLLKRTISFEPQVHADKARVPSVATLLFFIYLFFYFFFLLLSFGLSCVLFRCVGFKCDNIVGKQALKCWSVPLQALSMSTSINGPGHQGQYKMWNYFVLLLPFNAETRLEHTAVHFIALCPVPCQRLFKNVTLWGGMSILHPRWAWRTLLQLPGHFGQESIPIEASADSVQQERA